MIHNRHESFKRSNNGRQEAGNAFALSSSSSSAAFLRTAVRCERFHTQIFSTHKLRSNEIRFMTFEVL